ncbi:hypothetical protein [Phocicoccus pinnipedialis]|uniref:Uncharacterized protein n=1 Tax=Phocicoccus pinnipedialis TaxID=110845 RepID=A0A6V7R6D0_9BACL|nr:hypothetical protein [Jeotgalicoccus pinnipedialis]MBP1939805.1 hypothetical protein [Jeotgalicoccus pinnipedialis]CAD2072442.1 hypothetical protein JEOPIN946_00526 [Jeotgalicoccus pinnipedialis]
MTRVILILLLFIQMLFFINFTLNEGILFFNIYIWVSVALISIVAGARDFMKEQVSRESTQLQGYFSLTLVTLSLSSLVFVLYIVVTEPYYL